MEFEDYGKAIFKDVTELDPEDPYNFLKGVMLMHLMNSTTMH